MYVHVLGEEQCYHCYVSNSLADLVYIWFYDVQSVSQCFPETHISRHCCLGSVGKRRNLSIKIIIYNSLLFLFNYCVSLFSHFLHFFSNATSFG